MPESLDEHYQTVASAIRDGQVIPFFGAGINLCGRDEHLSWAPGCSFLPSGGELSKHLAERFRYPLGDKDDLLRVSQYAATMRGSGPLYGELRALFETRYDPTPAHRFFAELPSHLRKQGALPGHLLIVTTNYDDVMERAFADASEAFDVVTYVAKDKLHRGKFWHRKPGDDKPEIIEKPNAYLGLTLQERSVLLKIHGAVDRASAERDSFVITEDDYIDYLTRSDVSNLVPVQLLEKLRSSHFLFLGYSLRDWNLRVILYRIWYEQKLDWKSWAVQRHPDDVDRRFWNERDVEILDARLEDYLAGLCNPLGIDVTVAPDNVTGGKIG